MIFEIIDVISTMALLLIAIQLSFISIQFRKKFKYDIVQKTYDEIYKNSEQRNLLLKVSSYVQGREFDIDNLMHEDEAYRKDVFEALNYCEYLAMGIEQGILDERLVQTTYRNLLYVMHSHFDRLIKELRMNSNDPETFRHFSQLMKKWRA